MSPDDELMATLVDAMGEFVLPETQLLAFDGGRTHQPFAEFLTVEGGNASGADFATVLSTYQDSIGSTGSQITDQGPLDIAVGQGTWMTHTTPGADDVTTISYVIVDRTWAWILTYYTDEPDQRPVADQIARSFVSG